MTILLLIYMMSIPLCFTLLWKHDVDYMGKITLGRMFNNLFLSLIPFINTGAILASRHNKLANIVIYRK